MTPQPPIRRNQPPPPAPPTTRQLWRDARHILLHWEHTCERHREEARLILAGEKADLKRLQHLADARDTWWAHLQPILRELADRTRAIKKNRLPHDDDHEWLTTAAQTIARAATGREMLTK